MLAFTADPSARVVWYAPSCFFLSSVRLLGVGIAPLSPSFTLSAPPLFSPFSVPLSLSLCLSPFLSVPLSLSLCLSLRLLPVRPSQPVPGMLLPHPCVRRCVGCLHRRRRGYLRGERDGEHGEGGPLQCFFSVFMPPLVPLIRLVEQHSSSSRFSWPPLVPLIRNVEQHSSQRISLWWHAYIKAKTDVREHTHAPHIPVGPQENRSAACLRNECTACQNRERTCGCPFAPEPETVRT